MRNFDEFTITDAVLQRIAGAREPRIRQISEALVRHLHAFVREIEPTQSEEWEAGDRLPDAHRPDVRRQAAGIHPAVGYARRLDAGRRDQSPGCRSDATETTVLGPFFVERRRPSMPAGRRHLRRHAGRAVVRDGTVQRRRAARRSPAPSSMSGIRTMTATTTCSTQDSGHARDARAASAPARTDGSGSGRSSPPPIRFRMTGRSARCWRRRAVIPGGPRMCIS